MNNPKNHKRWRSVHLQRFAFTLFGGMNVLESRDLAMEVASTHKSITDKLAFPIYLRLLLIKPTDPLFPPSVGPDLRKAVKFLLKSRKLTEFQ